MTHNTCMTLFALLFSMQLFSAEVFPLKPFGREHYTYPRGPKVTEIPQLQGIPFGEKSGLVTNVFELKVPSLMGVYNPSIVKRGDRYLIAFRYDYPWSGEGYKKVHLGLMETDTHFEMTKDPVLLDTGNDHSPDPRLFYMDNTLYISYAHLTEWGPPYECCIGLSSINADTLKTEQNFDLLYKKGPREKNWVPFIYKNERGASEMYFVYQFNPFTLVRVAQPLNGSIEHPIAPDFVPKRALEAWEKRWGVIRGGTPAILVDGEYLTFFHSSFQEQSLYWYVFGALTFDSKPPFALKRISACPILFKRIYQAPFAPQRNPIVRAIFPSGFVEDRQNQRDVLHVLCGENDSAIKVVTLDKEKLFKSLRSVD